MGDNFASINIKFTLGTVQTAMSICVGQRFAGAIAQEPVEHANADHWRLLSMCCSDDPDIQLQFEEFLTKSSVHRRMPAFSSVGRKSKGRVKFHDVKELFEFSPGSCPSSQSRPTIVPVCGTPRSLNHSQSPRPLAPCLVTGARTLAACGHQQSTLHGLGAMVSSDVSLNGALSSSSSPPQCAGTPACDPESDSNFVGWDHKLKDVELGIAGINSKSNLVGWDQNIMVVELLKSNGSNLCFRHESGCLTVSCSKKYYCPL